MVMLPQATRSAHYLGSVPLLASVMRTNNVFKCTVRWKVSSIRSPLLPIPNAQSIFVDWSNIMDKEVPAREMVDSRL